MTEIYVGSHLLLDLWECREDIGDIKIIEATLKNMGFEGSVQFKSFDITCITASIISPGTHMNVHVWPQHNYVAFDLFSNQNINHIEVAKVLKEAFNPIRMVTQELQRGIKD